MIVTVTEVDRSGGTVVTFRARDAVGAPVIVAIEGRVAHAIAGALEDGPVDVSVEPWQIVGRYTPSIPLSREERIALRALRLLVERGVIGGPPS